MALGEGWGVSDGKQINNLYFEPGKLRKHHLGVLDLAAEWNFIQSFPVFYTDDEVKVKLNLFKLWISYFYRVIQK